MSRAKQLEALDRAKADKAYYLWLVRNKLGVTHRVASDLYRMGTIPNAFPLPALLQDSESNLSVRWSQWYDTDRSYGIRY